MALSTACCVKEELARYEIDQTKPVPQKKHMKCLTRPCVEKDAAGSQVYDNAALDKTKQHLIEHRGRTMTPVIDGMTYKTDLSMENLTDTAHRWRERGGTTISALGSSSVPAQAISRTKTMKMLELQSVCFNNRNKDIMMDKHR